MDLKTLAETPSWEWPKDAKEILLGALRDERMAESGRCLAAELAGDLVVMDDEIAEVLLSLVGSGAQIVKLRGCAAIALGPALEQADTDRFDGFDTDGFDGFDAPISEPIFRSIRKSLHALFTDTRVPKEVRRRILEASVRAPEDWHTDAVHEAYVDGDESWKLTAVFCMRYIKGFEGQILESLGSGNPDILREAVGAAGVWGVEAAWPRISEIIEAPETDKTLLLAAIEAAASVRPNEAGDLLGPLLDSEDEEVAEAAMDAMHMADVGREPEP